MYEATFVNLNHNIHLSLGIMNTVLYNKSPPGEMEPRTSEAEWRYDS